jgi:hypothetical protein
MPKLLPHSGKKGSLLHLLLPEQNRSSQFLFPPICRQEGIWSFEHKVVQHFPSVVGLPFAAVASLFIALISDVGASIQHEGLAGFGAFAFAV